jgi:hypothetical protein
VLYAETAGRLASAFEAVAPTNFVEQRAASGADILAALGGVAGGLELDDPSRRRESEQSKCSIVMRLDMWMPAADVEAKVADRPVQVIFPACDANLKEIWRSFFTSGASVGISCPMIVAHLRPRGTLVAVFLNAAAEFMLFFIASP